MLAGMRKERAMAVEMTGRYIGNLKVELTHGPSGTQIKTAAPVDNQGDGGCFSPTDLASVALGTCMVTVMAIVAERDGIDMSSVSFQLEKHMSASPRRISRIPVTIQMPKGLTPDQRRSSAHRPHLPRPPEPPPRHREAGYVRVRGWGGDEVTAAM